MSSEEYRYLVRVAGTDLDGSKKLAYALTGIKGVGIRLAESIIRVVGLDPNIRMGFVSDQDVRKIEEVLANPVEHGIPKWMVNRQKDVSSGEYLHLTGSDLTLAIKTDIDDMRKMKSYRGIRHALGLKVRGQHTKTTGRKGQTVGVRRKKK
ncbi:MAG: 30S ribosomal protein S13 [Candidatus Freyarchaeota archaeon]|nr:30S ribosomal protein S13 [Candidatus Jordarchaeia archaeon]MBS7268649.1 30S ribosomal protein S13 [Candidatus Jordarchaeia archaeon]MBS7279517.1 30S ribosomal protein S13 [Candidatus Jordarchaeia archaeon]